MQSQSRRKVSHVDAGGLEHVCRLAPGDWIAHSFPGAAQPKPGKVTSVLWNVEADDWTIGVSFQINGVERVLYFTDVVLPRIRWSGRVWRYAT